MTATDLDRLRAQIRRIEGRAISLDDTASARPGAASKPAGAPWSFGIEAIDRVLEGGLAGDGLHEITPRRYGDSWAAIAFVLALSARRLATRRRPLLWCATARDEREFGRPFGHGLRRFGIDPARLVLVEAANGRETAFIIEEGLRCGRLAAAFAWAGGGAIDATTARRLSLAARAGATPALLLTPPASNGVLTAASRWRVAVCPVSGSDAPALSPPLHERAWQVELLRNRHGPAGGNWQIAFSFPDPYVEASHEQAFRFHPPAAAGDRESAAA